MISQVLPRGPEDLSNFFAVFYGAPVQVAYGTLGASILSQALEMTQTQQMANSEQTSGTQATDPVSTAELVHMQSGDESADTKLAVSMPQQLLSATPLALLTIGAWHDRRTWFDLPRSPTYPGYVQDSAELVWRQRAHAHLQPTCLNDSWGSHIRPAAVTSITALPFSEANDETAAVAGAPPDDRGQQDMRDLSPGVATANRAQTPLQHALLGPGEVRKSAPTPAPVTLPGPPLQWDHTLLTPSGGLKRLQAFTGTAIKGWTSQATAWPSLIQAQVARCSPGLFSVVLVLPGEVISKLLEAVAQQHLRKTVDLCLRVPAFRHLTVSVLAGLAQYCDERQAPSRHELLRQGHPISHVFLLISGSVDVTAFTPAHTHSVDLRGVSRQKRTCDLRSLHPPQVGPAGPKPEPSYLDEREHSQVCHSPRQSIQVGHQLNRI